MNRATILVLGLLFAAGVLADNTLFIVDQTERVLVTQFGDPVRVVDQPGLHMRVPFIQALLPLDNRLLIYQLPPEEVTLSDQLRPIVDSFVMLRIVDPLSYRQVIALRGEEELRAQLTSILQSSMRRVLGNTTLPKMLSSDRAHIMQEIREQVSTEMRRYGVAIEDVRIRRTDLPEQNTQAIISRMQSDRQKVALQLRAEGAEAAARIHADADRDKTVLLANANAAADKLRGQGEAEASLLYAQAYGQDADFFARWRTMQGLKSAFEAGKSRLVLTSDSDFLRLLATAPEVGSAAPISAPAAPTAPEAKP